MFEKVNAMHPDKVADRIAGAMVDLAYGREDSPRVAVEVLIGHGFAYVIAESSVLFTHDDVQPIIDRIAGQSLTLRLLSIPQDAHLADNQHGSVKAGDNGIFKGMPVTKEQQLLTDLAGEIYKQFPTDGKYIIVNATPPAWTTDPIPEEDKARMTKKELANLEANRKGIAEGFRRYVKRVTICQSHATEQEITDCINASHLLDLTGRIMVINPLGPWTGGPDVDCGATNRKLGSDMGDGVTGGGLHGKDLSKADVSVNIVCHLLAQEHQCPVSACCSIGDETITFHFQPTATAFPDNLPPHPDIDMPYTDVVEQAREYIRTLGGFEQFAEWGLIRPQE